MKLSGVKIQTNALDSDTFAIPVICNIYFCAFADNRASLGALNHGCCLVVFTPGNLIFRPTTIRFFAAHRYKFARHSV